MRKNDAGSELAEAAAPRNGTVQSIERAIDVLEAMADAGGTVGLSALATASGLPLPTIHRLVRTLAGRGYVRRESSRDYSLGPRLVRIGEVAGRLVGTWARPRLAELVDSIGETANLALLEGAQVVYVAQVPGRHSMRMFTEVGRRVSPHCTAVGKALLAGMSADEVHEILRRTDMVAHTDNTLTDAAAFTDELDRVRDRGYALDEGEQELGVRCVAVAVKGSLPAAISISGPTPRMSDELIRSAVPQLRAQAEALATELAHHNGANGH